MISDGRFVSVSIVTLSTLKRNLEKAEKKKFYRKISNVATEKSIHKIIIPI